MRGRFIVFEGGEGVGKSTQIERLGDRLAAAGLSVLTTREPGGTEEGRALRRLLVSADGAGWNPVAETLLMVADRVQHLTNMISPALAAGRHVLCDRYAFSTLAYQGGGRGVDRSLILDLHERACGDIWPDLTILLDADPAHGLARSRRRLAAAQSDEGRFEALDIAFHNRVRRSFLDLAHSGLGRCLVFDATRTADDLEIAIAAPVMALLSESGPDE